MYNSFIQEIWVFILILSAFNCDWKLANLPLVTFLHNIKFHKSQLFPVLGFHFTPNDPKSKHINTLTTVKKSEKYENCAPVKETDRSGQEEFMK